VKIVLDLIHQIIVFMPFNKSTVFKLTIVQCDAVVTVLVSGLPPPLLLLVLQSFSVDLKQILVLLFKIMHQCPEFIMENSG
jgi:hypothetical protein